MDQPTQSEHGADLAGLFNPMSPEFMANPHGAYAVTREKAPVCPVGPGTWVVTGREEMMAVLREPARFSSRKNLDGQYPFCDEAQQILADSLFYRVALFNVEPPEHGRFRAFINEEFSPRALRRREPAIRALAAELVDGFSKDGGVDLLSRLAYPLPMTVICDIIGVPVEDRATVKAWNNDWLMMQVVPLPPEEQVRCARSVVEYENYYRELLAKRQSEPKDDLLTVFVQEAAKDEPVCTLDDAIVSVRVMLAAGHETTSNLIANTMYQLLRDRQLWEQLVADPALAAAAVEEGLRFDPSVQGAPREATEDTTVGGVQIPAGAKVQAMFAAAGHDPATADDPDAFRLDRQGPPRHFGFGYGIHFCLGAPLARLESRIALETLAAKLPDLALAPDFEPQYLPGGLVFHGLAALPVVWSTD